MRVLLEGFEPSLVPGLSWLCLPLHHKSVSVITESNRCVMGLQSIVLPLHQQRLFWIFTHVPFPHSFIFFVVFHCYLVHLFHCYLFHVKHVRVELTPYGSRPCMLPKHLCLVGWLGFEPRFWDSESHGLPIIRLPNVFSTFCKHFIRFYPQMEYLVFRHSTFFQTLIRYIGFWQFSCQNQFLHFPHKLFFVHGNNLWTNKRKRWESNPRELLPSFSLARSYLKPLSHISSNTSTGGRSRTRTYTPLQATRFQDGAITILVILPFSQNPVHQGRLELPKFSF